MKKPFGLDGEAVVRGAVGGEAVVRGAVVALTVFGELDLAEPQAATSIASATPTAAEHANLRHDAIGSNSGISPNAKQAADSLSATLTGQLTDSVEPHGAFDHLPPQLVDFVTSLAISLSRA